MSSDFNLQEELLSLASDLSLYHIPSELDVLSLNESSLDAHLSSAIESIVNDPDSVVHSSGVTFDVIRSILKHADSPCVGGTILVKTLDTIMSSLTHHTNAVIAMTSAGAPDEDVDAPMAHRIPLEMWAFLIQWFVTIGERGAGRSSTDDPAPRTTKGKKKQPVKSSSAFVWSDHLRPVLGVMHRALRLPTSRIWRTTSEREAFVSCFVKPSYQLCESEQHLKSQESRLGIYKVICLAVKFHGHAFGAQTSIIQNLTYFEHLSEPMAELLAILEKEFDYPQLAEEVLRDVASKSFAHNDAKGPRSFSKFLVRFAELSPRIVQKQMSLLLAHLDSEVNVPFFENDSTDDAYLSRLTPCVWPLSRLSVCSFEISHRRMKVTKSKRRNRSNGFSNRSWNDSSISILGSGAKFSPPSSNYASEHHHLFPISK